MGLLSFLSGLFSKPRRVAPAPAEIAAEAEAEGWVDLGLGIRSHETLSDGTRAVHACGVHHGREVGLTVVLGSQWTAGKLAPNIDLITFRGAVTFRSTGEPSDALLVILDQLYATKLAPAVMRPETAFVGISLAGEPGDLAKGPARIKLFYESDDEHSYAELYAIIDLSAGVLQIHEKDPEYRSAIIRALSGK